MGAKGALHQPFLADPKKVKYPADTVHIFMAHLRPRAVAAILVRAFQEYYTVSAKLKGPQDQRLIDAADAHHPYQVEVRRHAHPRHPRCVVAGERTPVAAYSQDAERFHIMTSWPVRPQRSLPGGDW